MGRQNGPLREEDECLAVESSSSRESSSDRTYFCDEMPTMMSRRTPIESVSSSLMLNGKLEKCAVDVEDDLDQRSGAEAAERVHVEALDDDEDELEADRDAGATMSDPMQRCSGSAPPRVLESHIFRKFLDRL